MDAFTAVGMLLTVIAILFLAYYGTRIVAKFRLGNFKVPVKENKNMQIIDQLILGQDIRLVLVQVGERYLLLGISSGAISTLAQLDPEEAQLWLHEKDSDSLQAANPSFKDAFVEAFKNRRK